MRSTTHYGQKGNSDHADVFLIRLETPPPVGLPPTTPFFRAAVSVGLIIAIRLKPEKLRTSLVVSAYFISPSGDGIPTVGQRLPACGGAYCAGRRNGASALCLRDPRRLTHRSHSSTSNNTRPPYVRKGLIMNDIATSEAAPANGSTRTRYYLRGRLAPVESERGAQELPVTGVLPPELNGRLFRNGPNPLPGEDPGHWFAGQGMLHGIRLRNGRAEWYRNRWVRTGALEGRQVYHADGSLDLTAGYANTNVIRHADRILALVENTLPYQVTPELDTVGPCDFGGRLTTGMTAHPKQDPVTGDLHFFGYGIKPPYLTYHRATPDGQLAESLQIAVPAATMMHDFAITEHHIVWLDLPVVLDRTLKRPMGFRWDDRHGARIGVMRQDGRGRVQWFEIEGCYMFHVGNAREDAHGNIVLDGLRYSRETFTELWDDMQGSYLPTDTPRMLGALPHRWTLSPATGRVSEQGLDDRPAEFPTLNDTRIGRPYRYQYAVDSHGILKYDLQTGASSYYDAGEDNGPDEAVFVPAADDDGEDAGWLLSIVTEHAAASRLDVLEATTMTRVAHVDLPYRVPAGFHGNWLPDTDTEDQPA
jgi:carotenoid cleavage dioxygenase